jgi:ribosomal protein S18 acetylase RimI-like enzyme
VNVGDDWGLESLAWTKMSYRPIKLLNKYVIGRAVAARVDVPAAFQGSCSAAPAVVRVARKDDVSAAVELERSCFSAYCLTKRQFLYLQKRPSAVILVAEQGGRIVGEGVGLVRQHQRGRTGRIYSLAVDGASRRQNIGGRLLEAMLSNLTARGVERVYLEVEQDNAPAVRMYQHRGFRPVGRLSDYYGPGRDGLHMVYDAAPQANAPAR